MVADRQQYCCNNGKGKGVEIPSLITITMGKKYVIKQHCNIVVWANIFVLKTMKEKLTGCNRKIILITNNIE